MTNQWILAVALLGFAAPSSAAPPLTACDVLTKSDLAAAQGQQFTEATLSTRTQGSISVSQCFFRMPAFDKSVSVTLMRPASARDRSSIRDYWSSHYATLVKEKNEDRDDDDRKHGTSGRDGDEEEHPGNAVRVAGLGDDAVWSGSPVASALHILRSGTIVRISLGGSATLDQKLAASRQLAVAILKRLDNPDR